MKMVVKDVTAWDLQLHRNMFYRQGPYCGTDRRTGKYKSCSTVTKIFNFFYFLAFTGTWLTYTCVQQLLFAYGRNDDRISMLQLLSSTFILLNSVHCSSVLRYIETDDNNAARTHRFASNERHQMTIIRLSAQSVTRLQTEEHRPAGVGMH